MAVDEITLSGDATVGVGPHIATTAQLPLTVKLGRIRPKAIPSVLRFANYFSEITAATPPPDSINRRDKAAAALARMYMNDRIGCCVISGKAHALAVWAANDANANLQASDQEIYSQYQSICGPGDNGCVITNVLDVMRSKGFIAAGQAWKIDGYVLCDWRNKLEVQVAQYLFGAGTIGLNLPQAWTENAVWDVTSTQIVGGHDVTVIDYDASGVYISSWGRIYRMTWAAFTSTRWIEEYYALLAPLWYGSDGLAPCGVDVVTLKADLAKLGNGIIPDITPTPPVPPAPAVKQTFSFDRNPDGTCSPVRVT